MIMMMMMPLKLLSNLRMTDSS